MKTSSTANIRRRFRAAWAPSSAEKAPVRWLMLCGVVLMAAIAIGTGVTISKFRESAIETGKESLESSVLLLARHFDQHLDDFSVLQGEIAEELEAREISEADIFRSEMGTLTIHEMMRQKAKGWSDLAGVNLFDAKGILINSSQSWPVADIEISDRAYFQRLRDDFSVAQTVDVVPSRFTEGLSIVFARRILGPNGEFLGAITRGVKPEVLESFFASAGLGPEATVAMHERAGVLLARYPHVEKMIGKNFNKGPSEQRAVFERPQFAGELRSPMDGEERLVASRMLGSVPLVIVATKTVDSTLATWRAQTRFFISMAVLSLLVTVLMLYLIFQQMMRQRRLSQRLIAVEKERLDTAISHMSQGLLLFDSSERLIICNRRYIEMYGLSQDVVKPGCTLRELLRHRQATGSFHGDIERYCDDILRNHAKSATTIVEAADGRLIQVRNEPVTDGGWLATHEDVTERVRAEERIAHLAHFDVLTDLPNRVSFREHVESRLSKGLSEEDRFAILYIDVDEFKSINDSLGHHVGDELLKCIASRLRESVGPGDLVARLGGDEFAIVKIGCGDQAALAAFVENLYHAIRVPATCCGHDVTTDASIGIAVAPDDGTSIDQLVKNADLAMYDAKLGGRRTFRFFTAEMGARMQARRALELDLRQAIAARAFDVYYQPLVDLTSNTVTGCEALLRWNHCERGFVSPAEFIPLAEETGLIIELGDWVLERACSDAVTWPDHVVLAVNVSPVQFKSKALALKVAGALARSGLSPNRLELEITEAVLIRDDEEALATLLQLRDLGVRISLDDFGTGYSSLSYLQRFPFDKIKIDRSFVNDVCEAGGSSPIVRALVAMALARSMSTTAEGVETEAQRKALRELGCTQMQGFLFSPAVPTKRLMELFGQAAPQAFDVA
jgi:diguanylate cyclase (GGDEF)-like protein/PAS domain S-box-containing protein